MPSRTTPLPTRAEILSWPTTVDLPTAGGAFGLGTNASYDTYHRGELPVEVVRLGGKLRVITSSIWRALGLDPGQAEPVPPTAESATGSRGSTRAQAEPPPAA